MIPSRFLFRFTLSCPRRDPLWTGLDEPWDEARLLPQLAELEEKAPPFDVYAAWSAEGLAFRFEVREKKQDIWCRPSRIEDSDGVQLWIDTRDVRNVHRASRFCHRFVFLPTDGTDDGRPIAEWLSIHRAKEQPAPVHVEELKIASEITPDGYRMQVLLPAHVLTGFDPEDHRILGVNYVVRDRELGNHTLSPGPPFPFEQDPSLWVGLELEE